MSDHSNPVVSIIIPIYNVEQYLSGCLDSVIAQTFHDIEIICVNDGSKDNGSIIIQEYAAKDKRIVSISQKNQGLSVARNTGLEVANGKYILFLDSDDYIHPQAIEMMIAHMNDDIDIVCANFEHTTKQYHEVKNNFMIYTDTFKGDVHTNPLVKYLTERKTPFHPMVWNKLYRADIMQNIRFIPKILSEDEAFTAMVMEKCRKLTYIDFKMYRYFVREGSIMTKPIDELAINSAIKTIEVLCNHFSSNQEVVKLVKQRKVKSILSICYKRIKYLEVNEQQKLLENMRNQVRILMSNHIINYGDFDIEGKYKLFRILYLS